MNWGRLLGDLAADLVTGRGLSRTFRNARYTAAREASSSVARTIDERRRGAPKAVDQDDEAAFVLIRAMISAAAADGHIDETERAKIMNKAKGAGLTDTEMKRIESELSRPLSPEALAEDLQGNDPSMVYRLSLGAIELDEQSEFVHLSRLARALGLSQDQVAAIHNELKAPPPQ